MSCKLWQYFLQDDLDGFKGFLANASYAQGHKGGSNIATASKFGGAAAALGTSPGTPSKIRRSVGPFAASPLQDKPSWAQGPPAILTRADVNARDRYGRTLLHLAASSQEESALEFVEALLAVPFIDIYSQDTESGWTALHRALYAGNAAVAQALLARDVKDAIDFRGSGGVHHPSGGLIRIKDREGNSPFDLFAATVVARDINHTTDDSTNADDDSSSECSSVMEDTEGHVTGGRLKPLVNLLGDEVFTFGSNKNLSLGLGDGDDRQFPERISLTRPDHLLYRFYHEKQAQKEAQGLKATDDRDDFASTAELPIKIRTQPIMFQDIAMSKLHTAILTTDPESNLYMSGFGPGGRLGTGDEATRFNFVCIESGGIVGKKIVNVALGQDHSIAISDHGEVFTWGSNKYGQLGYALPKTSQKDDLPVQTTPRQVYNPFKKEVIVAAAASAIHSVVYTSTSIYTFGKNEGQLGLIDADARSLEMQVIPRKVGASLFTQPIAMVSAIDRATAVLLENHDVWVFTHYGYSKLIFPLDGSSSFIRDSFLATRYGLLANFVTKITGGGNTICAMSSFGEVYTVDVSRKADTHLVSSTTNPSKIKNSLPQPSRVWSIRKSHMAVRDVDVGQDGSIIICTESGSAWRKEPRHRLKDAGGNASGERQTKDYKFVRISGLSQVVAVRSNAFGAYAAAQRSHDVTKKQIVVGNRTLWRDLWSLLPFGRLFSTHVLDEVAVPDGPNGIANGHVPEAKKALSPADLEIELVHVLQNSEILDIATGLVWVSSTSSDVRIPVHEFILAARSSVLRQALSEFRRSYYYSIPEILSIEYNSDGQAHIQFHDCDILSVFNLVLFMYTDQAYGVWNRIRHDTENAPRYRQVRTEVVKLAIQLDLKSFERAAKLMIQPKPCLNLDMDVAISNPSFFESSDVIIDLDGGEVRAHSPILCQRCPFFDALFNGRAGGRWLSSRKESSDSFEAVHIDLKHIGPEIFQFVLRYIYADTDDELFEDVRTTDLDDFVDLIIDVMFVANELMIDRLAQICQNLLGSFVNIRNVVPYLNAVAPCSVTAFKRAALEYMCLNLEVMLESRLLDDLDPDLFDELNEICRQNQMTYQPIARGRNAEEYVLEKYPEIISQLEQDKQRRIDSMRLRSRLHEDEVREEKLKFGSIEKQGFLSPMAKNKQTMQPLSAKASMESPLLRAKPSNGDLMFPMDDDALDTGIMRTPKSKTDANDQISASAQDNAQSDAQQTSHLSSAPPVTQGNRSPGAPWGLFGPTTPKAGLKDIMAETSDTKAVSSHAFSLTNRDTDTPRLTPSKLSQKERKKMKHQQLHEVFAESEPSNTKPSASPWQVSASRSKSPFNPQTQEQTPSLATQRSKTSLTLRQTVAKTPPVPAEAVPEPSSSSTVKPPSSKPKPVTSTNTSNSNNNNSSRPSTTPKFSNSSPLPLAAILQQQQFEKDLIREAATAKHNLHDIQLEQEFQQWWEAESKRVMEEEAAAAAAAAAAVAAATTNTSQSHPGRGGGGGGAGRGRGRSRGTGANGHTKNRGDHGQNHGASRTGTTNAQDQTPSSAPQGPTAQPVRTTGDRPPQVHHQPRGTQDKRRNNNDRGREGGSARGHSGGGGGGGGINRGTGRGRGRISQSQH